MNAAGRLFDKAQAHPLARFAAVGVIATAIDFVVFSTLVLVANVGAAPANAVSYATSLVANFNLNRRWTFRQQKDPRTATRQGGRFLVANAGGLLLSTAIVGALATALPELWAKVISVPIVFVYNYACAKLWVYREAASKEP
jgi:putative flippase GtrA